MPGLALVFASVDDPRADNARHDLAEILFIALAAVICGAQGCADIALFGCSKEKILRRFLTLPHGVPSHDTFSRVFRALDPESFSVMLGKFAEAFGQAARASGVVAIDGKACRRGYEAGKAHAPPVMVSAWGADLRMTLALAPAENGAEAAAALEVIALLDLAGAIVTADALHCHRRMAAAIGARGGDYVLALKGNQPSLLRDAEACLKAAPKAAPSFTLKTKAHGRIERRTARVVTAGTMAEDHDFPNLAAIICIETRRGGAPKERRLFLSSKMMEPEKAITVTRAHWDIENGLHWVLDVVLREDDDRARKDHAPDNLAILRRLALNAVRAIDDPKTSLRGRVKRAGWDDEYFLKLVAQMR